MNEELAVCSDPENYMPDCFDSAEYDYDDFKCWENN